MGAVLVWSQLWNWNDKKNRNHDDRILRPCCLIVFFFSDQTNDLNKATVLETLVFYSLAFGFWRTLFVPQELFVEMIAKDAMVYAQQGKRKTLQRKDLGKSTGMNNTCHVIFYSVLNIIYT